MNTSLYQLSTDFIKASEDLMNMDIPEEVLNDTLESMVGDIQVKSTNVAMFIRNLEVSAEAIREAEKNMAARRKAIENRAEQIKNYLLHNMQRVGISKIECPHFALTIKKNPPKVEIHFTPPQEFMREPETPPPEPDKKLIAEYLKAGNKVDWAELSQSERLDIK